MLHALLHGQWGVAWRFNLFALLSMPYLVAIVYTSFSHSNRAQRLQPKVQHPTVVRGYLLLVVLWWVLRNTPIWNRWIEG